MHNSQNDAEQAHSGAGAGWDGSNALTSGTSTSPIATLLKSDCIGCHSSTTGSTRVDMNGSGNLVPIVFNTGGYPGTPLAGGNFYFTSTGAAGNNYGHNVQGIADPEIDGMAWAPGDVVGCSGSCHQSLAIADPVGSSRPTAQTIYNGCRGCHTRTSHHNGADTSYRFLGGHPGGSIGEVRGIEDPDWEYETATDHNLYLRSDPSLTDPLSIGRFCAGCHGAFHAQGVIDPIFGVVNGGDPNTDDIAGNNPWLRHPSNVNIPNNGEYAAIIGSTYNPTVPVAKPLAGNPSTVEAGDQVMCLSCHRAHASQYPDALRFPYNTMTAHNGTGNVTDGCFYCHREKDLP
ncbi:MAG: hypothetical protein KKG47_03265 [Proteobacteria bacterium]|nr:hypothetical protein [Pseudomonadota bacterium]MBU1739029.1 hypothetical protein [Pseudomonadota bacterium]